MPTMQHTLSSRIGPCWFGMFGIPGFKCFSWDNPWFHTGIPSDITILFVWVETAASERFLNALKIIKSRVARIVVDEAHLVITWSTFRPDMHKLVYLRDRFGGHSGKRKVPQCTEHHQVTCLKDCSG